MKHKTIQFIFAILAFTFCTVSYADNKPTADLIFAVGNVAVFDSNIDNPLVYKLEYRFAKRLKWDLIPVVGAAYSEDNASFVFTTVEKDYKLKDNWIISPSFGLGIFKDGENLELGHTLEFRSGVKLYYEFKSKNRLALEFFHLSNGGISDQNPGTEPAFISVSMPF